MFKPGEKAIVRESNEEVTVVAVLRESPQVMVLRGEHEEILPESNLYPGHHSVVATAEGRNLTTEAWITETSERHKNLKANIKGRDLLTTQLQAAKLDLDLRGHWKGGSTLHDLQKFKDGFLSGAYLYGGPCSQADYQDLLMALFFKQPLNRWINIGSGLTTSSYKCSFCGAENFTVETNGTEARLSGDACPYPDGLGWTEWELNIPSGQMVVENDLRDVFPMAGDQDDFDVNTRIGCRLSTLAYAEMGMSHAYVGNSCPQVYLCEEGKYKIANQPDREEWNEETKEWVEVEVDPPYSGERVTGICTDLWWYSICDLEEYQRRCVKFGEDIREGITILHVKPGVYRFRHNEDASSIPYGNGEVVYTTFEWVRDPDPVRDYLAQYEDVDVNPHAYVQAQAKRWPTLYGRTKNDLQETAIPWESMTEEDRIHAWQRVADHIFCVIGGGTDWHEKGFPKAKTDPNVPDIEPPSFRKQHHWYSLSENYGGMWEPKFVAPSFAKLMFRVLESIISFGTDVNDGSHSREVYHVRKRMLLAVRRYRELMVLYPEQADPEYVWWLTQEGRAEQWVGNFPLGPTFTEKHRNHAAKQRWVPDDTYAVEFDSTKVVVGQHATKIGWSKPEHATAYAILTWTDNEQPPELNCFWHSHAIKTAVPLRSVARVVKVGDVSSSGHTLIELAYDYGTPWMVDSTQRKAIRESLEKKGIRLLTKAEYEDLLPKYKNEYEAQRASEEI